MDMMDERWQQCLAEAARRVQAVKEAYPGCEGARNGGGVNMPPPRNLTKEATEALQAEIKMAPQILASEQKYRPQFVDLETELLRSALVGRTGRGGIMDVVLRDIFPKTQQLADLGMQGEISSVENLGARATQAFQAANPQQARLLQELNRQAASELAAGARLDPGLRTEVSNAIRSAQGSRGMGFGPTDMIQEVLYRGNAAEQLRRQRQGFAGQVAQLNQQTAVDPFLAILGRPSVAVNLAQQQQAFGVPFSQTKSNYFDAFGNQLANQIASDNFNAANQAAIQSAQNRAAITGAAISAVGSIAGGAMKCWVAREVYGDQDLRWLEVRSWIMRHPALTAVYIRHGQWMARQVARRPWLKRAMRWLMDKALERERQLKG